MQNSILGPDDYKRNAFNCNYLVVGTGAGGSVAGALLAESGRDVILLEEGGHYPVEDCSSNISDMTSRLYRNQGVFPFLGKPAIAFAEGCCTGGGTIINGGLLWRTPPWILDEWCSRYGLQGYEYGDLKKHFDTVEKDLHVVRHKPEDGENLDSMKVLKASENLGWKYVMVPRAVKNCENLNLCPTGCPSGAKQSMLETYLPRAMERGARIFTRCRAVKIIHSGGKAKKLIARVTGPKSRKIVIAFDHLVIAGGAVQTPHLIRRSGIHTMAGRTLQFHMNIKIIARFRDRLDAERGTMFTVQVQEFEREGLLIMASNMRAHYVAMTLSHYGNEVINDALNHYENLGIFVAMIRPKSIARVFSFWGDQPVVSYVFHPEDLTKIKNALRKTACLLFEGGACELYLPVSGIGRISSLKELDRKLEEIGPERLEIITVHVMASCPMGTAAASSVVNPEGQLWEIKNILVTDASVLPSNIGESPQGTIMAFAHEILRRHM